LRAMAGDPRAEDFVAALRHLFDTGLDGEPGRGSPNPSGVDADGNSNADEEEDSAPRAVESVSLASASGSPARA
jgi:hypothetical protein